MGIIFTKSSFESEKLFGTEDITFSIKTSSLFPPNKKNFDLNLELIF